MFLAGCVASAHKIKLSAALTDVVDSIQQMHDEQQRLQAEAQSKHEHYRTLDSYLKEVDVTFNISANGDVNAEGDWSAPVAAAGKVGLKLSGDYKSARGNLIVLKFASILDNDALASGKLYYDKEGQLRRGTAEPGRCSRNPNVRTRSSFTPAANRSMRKYGSISRGPSSHRGALHWRRCVCRN
jgi:hypothetical protein